MGSLFAALPFIVSGLLLGSNLWTYHRLVDEQPVVDLEFKKTAPKRYSVLMTRSGNGPTLQYPLEGDEWRLEVRLIRWKSWLTLLGKDPLYRLDRLSGRYLDIEDELASPPSAHALTANPGLDLWKLARDSDGWIPGIDTIYGSGVYQPMADGARYRITINQSGLIARKLP